MAMKLICAQQATAAFGIGTAAFGLGTVQATFLIFSQRSLIMS